MFNKGILPNSNLRRNNASLNVSYDLSDKLKFSSSMQYVRNEGTGRFGTGYDNRNVNQSFRQWYDEVDMLAQKEAYELNNNNLSWNAYDSHILTILVIKEISHIILIIHII